MESLDILGNNRSLDQKTLSKIKFFVKNQFFLSKINFFVKNHFFCQKSNFFVNNRNNGKNVLFSVQI